MDISRSQSVRNAAQFAFHPVPRRVSPQSGKLRAYRLRAILPAVLVATYVVLAFFGPTQGKAEFYPFFTWNLFASSSSQKVDAVIIVRGMHGKALEEPRLFFDMPDEFTAARMQTVRLAKLLDNYVVAVLSKESDRQRDMQKVIETSYLSDVSELTYDVALIRYDPIERYRDGTIRETLVIATHDKRAP